MERGRNNRNRNTKRDFQSVGGGETMKKQAAWIQEKTKEEVEVLRDKLLKSGRIKSAGEIEKYIYCRNRKTGEPIYHYQCKCEEA